MVCIQQDIDNLKDVFSKNISPLNVYPIQEDEINNDLLQLFPNVAFLSNIIWTPRESNVKGILEAFRNNRTMVTKTVDGKVHAISFMSHYECKIGTTATIFYYGKDIGSFKALVVDHLKHLVDERKAGTLAGLVHISEFIQRSDVSKFFLEELGFLHGPLPDSDTVIISEKISRESCKL